MWRLLFLLLILLILRLVFYFFLSKPNYKVGDTVRISAPVSSEVVRYERSQFIKISDLKIYLPLYPEIHYGDKLVIEGRVEKEKKLGNVKLIDLKEGTGILFRFRSNLLSFFKKSLPPPHSSLVSGMVLGSKEEMGSSFWEVLKKTGTAHVVVASGMNVSLIGKFLISVLILYISRKKALALGIMGIWIYVVLSGFEPPIIRASIMATTAFLAQILGKLYQAFRALLLSSFLMLILSPSWLIDIGFILSFVATACLILFETKISRLIGVIPKVFRESLSTSLAAQIGVAPIIFVTFGQFNILSPFINALILWTVPLITILGALSGLIGVITPFLGSLAILLIYPLSWWFITIVNLFS